MIQVQSISDQATQLVVQGNRSMSWRANLWLVAFLAFIVMGIALAMAWMGFWMVIPFAGAEVLFVLGCLHYTLRRLEKKEVITVDRQAIRVEWGYNKPDTHVRLPRQWARLRYQVDDSPFDVGRLSVAAHGRQYLLGQALGRTEKQTLYAELNAALQRYQAVHL